MPVMQRDTLPPYRCRQLDAPCSGEVDMDDGVIRALRLYLNDSIDFDSLEDRIIPVAFEAEAEDGGPVFEVVAEIAYVKDRVSDEGVFRERVAGLVAGQQPRRWRKSHSAIMRRSKLYARSNCSST